MKKIFAIAALLISVSASAQVYKSGNTFKVAKSSRGGAYSDTLVTKYFYEDSKGKKYPICLRKKDGVAYIFKGYTKSGNPSRTTFTHDNDVEISVTLSKEYNIKFTYEKKSKKK